MIKKLLLSVLVIAFANGLMAQELSVAEKGQWVNLNKVSIEKPVRTTTPLTRAASSYIWWGYPDGGGYVNVLGFDMLSTMLNGGEILKGQKNYNLAMEVPAVFCGATVDSVSIGFLDVSKISNLKVWFAEYKTDATGKIILPTSAAKADYSFTVSTMNLKSQSFNDIKLPKPYTIPASGCIVGYSFIDAVGTNPILLHATVGTKGGFYMQYNKNSLTRDWIDGSNWGMGDLTITLHMDATNLPKNQVSLAGCKDDYLTKIGEQGFVDVYVNNDAVVPVSEVSYVLYKNGLAQAEQTVALSSSIMNNTLGYFSINVPTEVEGVNAFDIEITKVNGEPNETTGLRRGTANVIALNSFAERTSVIEEFTGSWCGYCPRGTVALNRLKNIYGDKIITIAGHYGDPMQCPSYFDFLAQNAGGFPDAVVDRIYHGDPYKGMDLNDDSYTFGADKMVEAVANVYPSEATISLNALWTDDTKTKIQAQTSSSFLYTRTDKNPYAVVFVLCEDGMTGTTDDWQQANYYTGNTAFNDPDMLKYINGGDVVDEVYNHVAVQAWDAVNGMNGSIASVTKNVPQDFGTILDISDNTLIQNKSNLSLAALLINRSSGRIVNAAQVKLGDETGISGVISDVLNAPETIYNLNGVKVSTSLKGINLIRKADGRVVKVVK